MKAILDMEARAGYHAGMTVAAKNKANKTLPPHKKVIKDRLDVMGSTMQELSLRLGRREAYIHQYLYYNTPKKLDGDDRKVIADFLNIEESQLLEPAGNPQRAMAPGRTQVKSDLPGAPTLAPPLQLTNGLATQSELPGQVELHLYRGDRLAMKIAIPADAALILAQQLLDEATRF